MRTAANGPALEQMRLEDEVHKACRAVLIDTDVGDDVDDAFGLALAAIHPALRVCGVTMVCGPVEQRARLAQMVLTAAGHPDVPVAPGSSIMSDGRRGSARFSHLPLLAIADCRLQIADDSESQSAICNPSTALRTSLRSAINLILECSHREEPLTLIALGPLTNIAAALRQDPALARRARLVAMAGKLGLPYPDWNLRCDPGAARAVLASGMPITLVGMHLTMRCKLRPAQVSRLFADSRPLAIMLARCVLAWRTRKRRMPILHDALTVAVAADPTIVTCAPRHVRILSWGFSVIARQGPPNALVCTSVDLEHFFTMIDRHLLDAPALNTRRRSPIERLLQRIA